MFLYHHGAVIEREFTWLILMNECRTASSDRQTDGGQPLFRQTYRVGQKAAPFFHCNNFVSTLKQFS